MKKNKSFWESLEAYGWKVARRSHLPYSVVGVGLVLLVMVASWIGAKSSVVGARNERELIERAARAGDYELAKNLFDHYTNEPLNHWVLGAESVLEELVYPEEKLAREIERWEEALGKYPGNREIMRGLAQLYEQAGEREKAGELREQVRKLDPNGE